MTYAIHKMSCDSRSLQTLYVDILVDTVYLIGMIIIDLRTCYIVGKEQENKNQDKIIAKDTSDPRTDV